MMSKLSVMVTLLFVFNCPQVNIAAEDISSCGPSEKPHGGFPSNVDPSSRCLDMRMYTANPETCDGVGGINNLYQRFREQEVAIFFA